MQICFSSIKPLAELYDKTRRSRFKKMSRSKYVGMIMERAHEPEATAIRVKISKAGRQKRR